MIVIGGGCAGFSASMYAARFNLKTLVIAKQRGGMITETGIVENYPGFEAIEGIELGKRLEKHAQSNGVEIFDDNVLEIRQNDDMTYYVKTEFFEKEFISKAIIIATGSKHRKLGIGGEQEFFGKGVSYCATCDGNFFAGKTVIVAGGSDSAIKESIMLAQKSTKVYLIARGDKLKGEFKNVEKIKNFQNIEIILNTNVLEVCGDKRVESVKLDNPFNGSYELKTDAIFVSIGIMPNNELGNLLELELSKNGEIVVDKHQITSRKGVFAAGDVVDFSWKQGIVASAQGAIAAHSAFEYITSNFK